MEVEVVSDYVTAMTSRFCPVKSYSGGCNCTKNTYVIKDTYNNVPYDLVCDNTDCIVKLVRTIPNTNSNNSFSKRKCII